MDKRNKSTSTEAVKANKYKVQKTATVDETMDGTTDNTNDEVYTGPHFSEDAEENFKLGKAYHEGAGVEKDFTVGNLYLHKAAEQGHPMAQYQYAYNLLNAIGCSPGMEVEALHWYKKAVAQGVPIAMNDLGYCYQFGRGVAKDIPQGIVYYKMGISNNNPHSMHNLARCCEWGDDGPKDVKRAVELFGKAAELDFVPSLLALGKLYSSETLPNSTLAFQCYLKAANLGDAEAAYSVSELFRVGKGVAMDTEAHRHWLKTAADKGNFAARLKINTDTKFVRLLMAQEWPSTHHKLAPACQDLILQICCYAQLPFELVSIVVGCIIQSWPTAHVPYYNL